MRQAPHGRTTKKSFKSMTQRQKHLMKLSRYLPEKSRNPLLPSLLLRASQRLLSHLRVPAVGLRARGPLQPQREPQEGRLRQHALQGDQQRHHAGM